MTCHDVDDLYAHAEWATDRILTAAEALDAEAWARDLGGSFPTLGGTLAHLVGAEWIWVLRWTGEAPTARPAWVEAPTPTGLRAALADVERRRRAFLAGLADADLARPLSYTLFSGARQTLPLRDVLLHVAHHATYHRGQAASMLRRLGAAPPATDYLVYALEARRETQDEAAP